MNERIRQLAIEARLIAPEYSDCTHTTLSPQEQKFALLIAQECAEIADQAEPYKATDLILKHFGIEKSRSQKLKEAGFTRRYKTWTKEKDDEI